MCSTHAQHAHEDESHYHARCGVPPRQRLSAFLRTTKFCSTSLYLWRCAVFPIWICRCSNNNRPGMPQRRLASSSRALFSTLYICPRNFRGTSSVSTSVLTFIFPSLGSEVDAKSIQLGKQYLVLTRIPATTA